MNIKQNQEQTGKILLELEERQETRSERIKNLLDLVEKEEDFE